VPSLLAGLGVDRHRLVVENVVEALAVAVGGAAVHHLAARDPDRRRAGRRREDPHEFAGRGVERE
jgi:hypothetical protein